MEGTRSQPDKAGTIVRSRHFWVIAALMVVLTVSYYADYFVLSWGPFSQRLFSSEYIHDLHRILFLVPMLYAASAFRLRGALVVSLVVFCVILPRALVISPHFDPILRAVIFAGVAGLAAVMLGLVQNQRQEGKRALSELQAAYCELMRYRNLFTTASDAIVVRDLELNIIEVNQAVSTLTGYTVDELPGMNIAEFFSDRSINLIRQKQQRMLRGKSKTERYELELIRKDGTRGVVDSNVSLVFKNGQAIGVQGRLRDITEQKRLRENMQFYITQITRAQEEERKRIARELHDETAQALATLLLDIDAANRDGGQLSYETGQRLGQLRTKTEGILEGVRRFSHELRPEVLDQLGLMPALELLTQQLNKEEKISASVELIGHERRLLPEAELVLFRIAQEALRNVKKHSQATEVVVTVEFTQDKVKLKVSDNGNGFELPETLVIFASEGKLGFIGMQERVRLLDGSFSVESQVNKGTAVVVEVGTTSSPL